ncbi:FERM and pleckstrin domain containing protein, partial [Fasciola gigantica]
CLLQLYQNYLNDVEHLILDIEAAIRVNPILDEVMRNFEAQKFCYLPFYVFLLKPMHRLLQYRVTLERLMRHYGETHPDAPNCRSSSSLQSVRYLLLSGIANANCIQPLPTEEIFYLDL